VRELYCAVNYNADRGREREGTISRLGCVCGQLTLAAQRSIEKRLADPQVSFSPFRESDGSVLSDVRAEISGEGLGSCRARRADIE
jgi:hypothetical protein